MLHYYLNYGWTEARRPTDWLMEGLIPVKIEVAASGWLKVVNCPHWSGGCSAESRMNFSVAEGCEGWAQIRPVDQWVVVSLGSCVPTDWLDWLLTIHGELRVSMAEGGRGGRRAEPPYKPGFVVVGSGVTTVTGTPPPPSSNTNNSSKNILIFI